jgi:hypothetical protein
MAKKKVQTKPAPETPAPATATAIVKKPDGNSTALTRDDFRTLGDTAIGAQDIQMPRLKLLQALSQPVIDQEAPAGNFWNSLTSEDYGVAVKVIPVLGFKNRVYLEPGKGLLCRSIDMVQGIGNPGIECAKCQLKDWPADRGTGGPKCRESRNWVALIIGASGDTPRKKGDGTPPQIKELDGPQFIVLQFLSMASAAAKKLNGLYLNAKITNPSAQWFDFAYLLNAGSMKNEKGTFFVPDIRPAGKTSDAEKEAAKSLLNFIAGKTLVVDVDADDESNGAAVPAPGQPSF